MPPIVGMVISARLATLRELQTDYGVLDVYNLAEVVSVDMYNRRAMQEAQTPNGNSN